jgi:long-chain acyl-CoA synthetase
MISELPKQDGSLPALLHAVAARWPHHPAQWLRGKQGYLPITYKQLDTGIQVVACGLLQVGVRYGDRVALLMENRPEWAIADYAILSVGAVTVPMYCTYRPQDIANVLEDCGARIVITSGGVLLQHLLAVADAATGLQAVYALDCGKLRDERLHAFADLQEKGADAALQAKLEARLAGIGRSTLATLVYTSGTTGMPKGVMLTHGNIMANLEAITSLIKFRDDDMMLSFLPLAHALERTGGHFLPYSFGLSVAFAERPDSVARDLAEAKPTMMLAVPRLLDVMRSRTLAQVAKRPAFFRIMFERLLSLDPATRRKPLSLLDRLHQRLLDRLVGRRMRKRFGGRLRLLISGGAPLNVETASFFEALGVPVLEGYGMTEAAPLVSVNTLDAKRIGSVGRPVVNADVKIAPDGEILVHGPSVTGGYWKRPRESEEMLIDGWLHTGDIGRFDADGYLYITDRKKDVIVNSGGENIAPQRIEGLLAADPLIDQAVVYGDQRPYLVALIVPNKDACMAWAKAQGLTDDWSSLCSSKALLRMLQTRVSAILHPLNAFEQVRRIHLLDTPFSLDDGMLTHSMKVRRREAFERFGDVLASLYRQ